MRAFRDLSIRQKLTMMGILASGGAILLACTAFLTYDLFAYRESMIRSLLIQVEIIGANSASAILFNDEPAAAETLTALKADPHIVSAGIYTPDNRVFATYGQTDKDKALALRARLAEHEEGHWFESDRMIVLRKIMFKKEMIGTVYIQSDLEEMYYRFWQYLAIVFIVLLASSSVALLISSRLQRKITQPLGHLVETARTVSREKDYRVRVAVTDSKDEMGVLVGAFNEMLEQIQQRDVALRRFSDEMEQRVVERTAQLQQANIELKQGEEALRRAHSELEQRVEERTAQLSRRSRDLETMLYVTSHDLREPLRSIENFSRMVSDRYADRLDEKGKDFLRRVMRSAQRMDRLMGDVLVVSRVQRMELPTEEVEGALIVEEAIRQLENRIKETGAQVRIVPPLPRFRSNSVWATQGVYNLLTNALKFTRPQEAPDVEIAAYHSNGEGEVGLVVRDRGPGVAPEYTERIFGLFQRAVGREVEGTGAGLAIVRQIAERHGGRAWVQTREGGGSEFILTFGHDQRKGDGNHDHSGG